jgi:uncharacterized membrane-anchored protein
MSGFRSEFRSGFRGRCSLGVALCFALFGAAPEATAQDDKEIQLPWQEGSMGMPIGDGLAQIDLNSEYLFLGAEGTQLFMELTQNPVNGREVATVMPRDGEQGWFLVFEYDDVGYVPDDEKDSLDAATMIASIREGTEAANAERRKRGWVTMRIVDWHEEPFYDSSTNNLTWSIIGESNGERNVNRMIKLLGREGVMTATLVSSPEGLENAAAVTDSLLADYRYVPGQTYAEFVPGTDKLAQYGLTALVVGGGAAALLKSGLLARFWKPLVVALAALGAGVKRLFFSGRSSKHDMDKPIG